MFVYKIENIQNNKVYIGFTSRTPKERYYAHCANAFNQNRKSRLYSAMRKYGKENFILETLYEGQDALEREQEFIEKYDAINNGYNMTEGGEANQLGRTWKLSEETKEKMRKPKPPRSKEHREALSQAHIGKAPGNKGLFKPDNEVSKHALYMREYRRKQRNEIV